MALLEYWFQFGTYIDLVIFSLLMTLFKLNQPIIIDFGIILDCIALYLWYHLHSRQKIKSHFFPKLNIL